HPDRDPDHPLRRGAGASPVAPASGTGLRIVPAGGLRPLRRGDGFRLTSRKDASSVHEIAAPAPLRTLSGVDDPVLLPQARPSGAEPAPSLSVRLELSMFKRLIIAIVLLGLIGGGIVWFKYFRDEMIAQYLGGM